MDEGENSDIIVGIPQSEYLYLQEVLKKRTSSSNVRDDKVPFDHCLMRPLCI